MELLCSDPIDFWSKIPEGLERSPRAGKVKVKPKCRWLFYSLIIFEIMLKLHRPAIYTVGH